jgi:hypothetical protein
VTDRDALTLSAVRAIPLILLLLVACADDGRGSQADRARRRTSTSRTDTAIPKDVIVPFDVPAGWDTVKLSRGAEYRQPPGFTLGLNDRNAGDCDSKTLPADSAILRTDLLRRWPLTLGMRRGDLTRLAAVNGFTLDSTTIGTHGQRDGDSTRVRRGEGWLLLSGRSWVRNDPVDVLFGAVRYPGGCYLVLAARGVEISLDTLGYVLGTLKFTAPIPPPEP